MSDIHQSGTASPRPLMTAFDPATRDDWRALVEKALKGADFEKTLVSRTEDGLRIEPIYARSDAKPAPPNPGTAPFTRGTAAHVEGLGWQIHQVVAEADAQTANRVALEELDAGTNGIVLQIAAPGQPGCAIASASEMATVLNGIALDFAPLQLHAGLNGLAAAHHALDALDIVKADKTKAMAHLNVDPLGTWARFGGLPRSLDDELSAAVALAKSVTGKFAHVRTVNVDATVYHEAGATDGQELAALAATLAAYMRHLTGAGLEAGQAFRQLSFTVAAGDDIFNTLAKLRAARRIIWRIADAFGAGNVAAAMHITARTSERMLAKRDPWTNLLRGTVACAASAFGGANAITVLPFTWALGQPDSFARRIARNTQIVCQEESSLGRVVDPAGGSWYIESLTDGLARAAWQKFQALEAGGGLEAALKAATLQNEIETSRKQRALAIATGRQALTGVSAFPLLGDDGVTVTPWPEPPPVCVARNITPLEPHRLSEAFEALRDASDAKAKTGGTHTRVFLANIGRVADHTLRSTWMKNFLAAGGIEAITNDGFPTPDAAAEAFAKSGTKAACICSSDALNREHAAALAKALNAKGAELIIYAGRPPQDLEPELNAAGVGHYIFAGLDAVLTLQGLQNRLS